MFKDKVLKILEENRGNEISGVDIAEKLGVTRAAVCKAVKQLRRSGNAIISRNNGGYTLEENSSALSEIGIKKLLDNPIDVAYYPETDSTNTRAKILALDKNVACALIVADSQTEGRGRRGRSFFSPKGSGVYFSIMFRPRLTYAECQRVVPMTAVAVSQAIENVCNQKTYIKWVNDLYYNGKKNLRNSHRVDRRTRRSLSRRAGSRNRNKRKHLRFPGRHKKQSGRARRHGKSKRFGRRMCKQIF